MKLQVLLVITFLSISGILKAQSFYGNDSLGENALTYKAAIRMDAFNNFSGGLSKGAGYLGEADIQIRFSTENAGLWKEGEAIVQVMNTHGKKPSGNFTGDFQTFSNIETDDHLALYEFWYNQHLFDDKISLLIGQLDMNADFSVSDNAMYFINSSFGVIPTLSLNNAVSIFPLLSPGFVAKYKPNLNYFFQAGIYNGNPGDFESNPNGVNWKFSKENGLYTIAEFHYLNTTDSTQTGAYKLGLFYHSAQFAGSGLNDTISYKGNYGIYATADQLVFSNDPKKERGLSVFCQASIFPQDRNFLNMYYGGGIRYHGLFDKRKNDDIGIAFASAWLSPNFRKTAPEIFDTHETAIELTYKLKINKNITIQPDVQYILNPGANKEIKDAFVGFVRLIINFEN